MTSLYARKTHWNPTKTSTRADELGHPGYNKLVYPLHLRVLMAYHSPFEAGDLLPASNFVGLTAINDFSGMLQL